MKLEELLQCARNLKPSIVGWPQGHPRLPDADLVNVTLLVDRLIQLSGVSFPCGFPEPTLAKDEAGNGVVMYDGHGYTPDEARGIAIAMLYKADEAEAVS